MRLKINFDIYRVNKGIEELIPDTNWLWKTWTVSGKYDTRYYGLCNGIRDNDVKQKTSIPKYKADYIVGRICNSPYLMKYKSGFYFIGEYGFTSALGNTYLETFCGFLTASTFATFDEANHRAEQNLLKNPYFYDIMSAIVKVNPDNSYDIVSYIKKITLDANE